LFVKLLRSPNAHAIITEIDTDKAAAVEGIECVLTYRDVAGERFNTCRPDIS